MKVRTKARRDEIVKEAALLFQEMGYERASMNELVKRIGGSKATLYRYFPSKEALFVTVVREHATQHLTEAAEGLTINEWSTTTLEQTLIRFGERKLQVVANDNSAIAVYRMVLAEAGHSDIGTLFYDVGIQESVIKLSKLMEAAMLRKELHQADPHLRALQFLSLLTAEVDMCVFQRQFEPISVPRIREIVDRAVQIFLDGTAPRSHG